MFNKADNMIVTMEQIENNFKFFNDKLKEVYESLQKICKHEEGFVFNNPCRYEYSKTCRTCGKELYIGYADYIKSKEEQEYNEAKKITNKYEEKINEQRTTN